MSDELLEIDIAKWVERAREDPVTYRIRQATEVVLNAIATTGSLKQRLFLKGGLLMGLAYESPRQTTDIDLTTSMEPGKENAEEIETLLNKAFPTIVAKLGYTGLYLQVHSTKLEPKKHFNGAEFPAIKLKIGYATIGTPQHKALIERRAAAVIELDISFNEPIVGLQILSMPEGAELHAYSLFDLIAEKFRAMLQQVTRNRNRRQDVFDLNHLIRQNEITDDQKAAILAAFLVKARSRHIEPNESSLDNDEVRRRSGADWKTLELELGEVPDFDECYLCVRSFYRSLPWP
jgi:hypothetical protein